MSFKQNCFSGIQDWANILFTDESRFYLDSSDSRSCVYRRVGERYADACAINILLCQIVTHYSCNMWSSVVLLKCDVIGLSLDERNDIRLNNFIPNNIPQSFFNYLVRSMRRRCQACTNANGGHTLLTLLMSKEPCVV
jgi:hypothetical protein